jgi:sporulation protein YlmC with PRC-barrel domain
MSTPSKLPDLAHRGRALDARLHLLDRQILDSDDNPVGTVDDLELDLSGATPTVTAVLSGHVFATRMLGVPPPRHRMQRVPWTLVRRIGITIGLRPTELTFDALWVEQWLRTHVIARIPGGRHEDQ